MAQKLIRPVLEADFAGSSAAMGDLPGERYSEFAFTGRSNVGKSSLINMLTGRKNLAHISNKPGKTRTINHFLIDRKWYLVDLPGYGYAHISKKQRHSWQKLMMQYLTERSVLVVTFVLIDISIPSRDNDLAFMRELGEQGIPFAIVFTKSDRLSANKLHQALSRYSKVMLTDWEEMPPVFVTDNKGRGREELLQYIIDLNEQLGE